LHHPRTARAAQETLDHHADTQARRGGGAVQGRAEPGAASSQDEDVEVEDVEIEGAGAHAPVSAVRSARPRVDVQSFVPRAWASKRGPRRRMNTVGEGCTPSRWITGPLVRSSTGNVGG